MEQKWHKAEIWIASPGTVYGVLVQTTYTSIGVSTSGLSLWETTKPSRISLQFLHSNTSKAHGTISQIYMTHADLALHVPYLTPG